MKFRIRKILFSTLFFILTLISINNIINFYRWYKIRPLEVILDIDYFLDNNINFTDFSKKISSLYVSKIAVDLYKFQEIVGYERTNEFNYVLKFYENLRYDKIKVKDTISKNIQKIYSIIYIKKNKNTSYLGEGSKFLDSEIFDIINESGLIKINFDNYQWFNIRSSLPEIKALRGFLCDLSLYSQQQCILKIKKAIIERSCSIIYILPSEFISIEENISIIENILKNIRFKKSVKNDNFINFNVLFLNYFLLFIFVTVLPLVIYKKILKKISLEKSSFIFIFLKTNFLTIMWGMIIWGLLQDYKLISLEKNIYGVKIMFILPVGISFLVLLSRTELKQLLEHNLKIKDFLFFIFLFILFTYTLIRTGNITENYTINYELELRSAIESFMLFRPRFKDFLFAQPLLLLSLFLLSKKQNLLNKIIFCISIVSQTSILNTFLHTHTPLHLCFLRVVLGCILGYIFFLIFFNIYNFIKKYILI
ncbi:MAG: DUF5693 family protein [Endomicrobia bacterium]|nr:DUF5693 family protein [Endomicrobiia bacterium]